MYRNQQVYGFHGLDKDIGLRILNQEQEFKRSENRYDWLGDGIYFWENNLASIRRKTVAEKYRLQPK